MRTKTLLLTAALVAAGVASSMAQSNVYSLNIVGYVNVPVTGGNLYLLANPLDSDGIDDINTVMTSLNANAFTFDGSSAFTFTSGGGYVEADYGALSATNGTWGENTGFKKLTPGNGFWFLPAGSGTVTFVGSVTLNSTNTIPGTGSGELSLIGSAYPASTNLVGLGMNWLANANGFNNDGDSLYRWNPVAQNFSTSPGGEYDFGATVGWGGPTGGTNGPTLNVAEGFFYLNQNNTSSWIQSFTVN